MERIKQNDLENSTTELGFVHVINSNLEDSGSQDSIAFQREVTLEDGTTVTVESVTPEKMKSILNANAVITESEEVITNKTPGETIEVNKEPDKVGPGETKLLDGVVQITNNTGSVTPITKTLVSIAVTTPPTKTSYTSGETFDPTGMVVTATYSDNSTAVITNYTYEPTTELETYNKSVMITYTENDISRSVYQDITVEFSGVINYTANDYISFNYMKEALQAAIAEDPSLGNKDIYFSTCEMHAISIKLGDAYENNQKIGIFGLSLDPEAGVYCVVIQGDSEQGTVIANITDSYLDDLVYESTLSDVADKLYALDHYKCLSSGSIHTDNRTFSVDIVGDNGDSYLDFTASDDIISVSDH